MSSTEEYAIETGLRSTDLDEKHRLSPGLTLDVIREEDVDAINDLYLSTYGSYPFLLRSEDLRGGINLVVRNRRGEVVAAARAVQYAGSWRVAEFGRLVVRSDYRGQHIGSFLLIARMKIVKRLGTEIMFSEPVCTKGCRSQHNLFARGWAMCGIQPVRYPGILTDQLDQPLSTLLVAKTFSGDSGFGHRPIYVPREWWNVFHAMVPVQVFDRGWSEEVTGSMPAVRRHQGYVVGGMQAADWADVPLNWPESRDVIADLERDGFLFSALKPGFGTVNGQHFDVVRMYRYKGSIHWPHVYTLPQWHRSVLTWMAAQRNFR